MSGIWKAALWWVILWSGFLSSILGVKDRVAQAMGKQGMWSLYRVCFYHRKPIDTFLKFWKLKWFTFFLNAVEDYIQILAMFTWRYPEPHFTLTIAIINLNKFFKNTKNYINCTPAILGTEALSHKYTATRITTFPTFWKILSNFHLTP